MLVVPMEDSISFEVVGTQHHHFITTSLTITAIYIESQVLISPGIPLFKPQLRRFKRIATKLGHNDTFDYVGVVVFVGRQERERRLPEMEHAEERYISHSLHPFSSSPLSFSFLVPICQLH